MFKQKKQKPCISDSRMTVSAKHNEMIQKFKTEKSKVLPQKERQLASLLKKQKKLTVKNTLTPIEHDMLYRLKKDISNLQAQIDEINNYGPCKISAQ